MKLVIFMIVVGISPAYLEKITSQLHANSSTHNSDVQAQEANENNPNERSDHKCPNNKVLIQTLYTLKQSLIQDGNQLDPEKFKNVLETLIEYLDNAQNDSDTSTHTQVLKDVMEKVNNRPKKEALRMLQIDQSFQPPPVQNPSEKLTGKVSFEYELPTINNAGCNSLFNAIVSALNAAYLQLSTFCATSGTCVLSNDKIVPSQDSTFISQQISEIAQRPQSEDSNKVYLNIQGTPQNTDIMTILQNYRPNTTISNSNGFITSQQENAYLINNGITNNQQENTKNSVLEVLHVLDKPSGYAALSQDSAQIHNSGANVQLDNTAHNIQYTGGYYQNPVSVESIHVNQNNTRIPPATLEEVRLIEKPSLYSNYLGYKPPHYGGPKMVNKNYQGYFINGQFNQGYPNVPYQRLSSIYNQNLNYPSSYLYHALQSQQVQKPDSSMHTGSLPRVLRRPDPSSGIASNTFEFLNSNQQIQELPNTDPRLANVNNYNAAALNDLYRLTTMTNGQKLNMAPTNNGMVELTFTLQRPKALEYKPTYYVKYILPYQTYMYNVQNLLHQRPNLRRNPAELYKELLDMANITESSQDLQGLDKKEISKLVVSSGALVKAKVVDGNTDSVDSIIADEVKNVLKLSSKLDEEGMLNATKLAISHIEKDITKNSSDSNPPKENNPVISSPNDIKSSNTRSYESVLHSNPQYENSLNVLPYYETPNTDNDIYKLLASLNKPTTNDLEDHEMFI